MCDTVNGAKDSAIVYSLTEIAKANGLKPYEYLKHLVLFMGQKGDRRTVPLSSFWLTKMAGGSMM